MILFNVHVEPKWACHHNNYKPRKNLEEIGAGVKVLTTLGGFAITKVVKLLFVYMVREREGPKVSL